MSGLAFFAKRDRSVLQPFRAPKAPGHDRQVLTASGSNEAYTPPDIVEAARYTLGVIDLDPCSNATANEVVRARHYFTATTDECPWSDELQAPKRGGLFLPWGERARPSGVWLNPPGGFVNRKTWLPSTRGMSQAVAWWRTLRLELQAGHVRAAVYYCFRLDVLQNIQAKTADPPPHAGPFCIFAKRPRHWDSSTPADRRGLDGAPTHACASFLVLPEPTNDAGRRSNRAVTLRFQEAHAPLGYVRL